VSDSALDNLDLELEGWAVGLRLASLALRRIENADRFLMDLHGGLQQTYEYLLQEVVAGETPEMRDWMLKTAIVDRFCQPLCEVLCAAEGEHQIPELDAAKFMETLINNNLFAIPLDARGEWFRYHHVFQLLLQQELENSGHSGDVATLHLKASAWFEGQGLIEQAIRHAVKAKDMVTAAEILERHRRAEQDNDGWRNVERWLAILPAETKARRPELLLAQIWILHYRWQLKDIAPIIAQLEALTGKETTAPANAGELNLFQGILYFWGGQAKQSEKHLLEARKLTPPSHETSVASIEVYLAVAAYVAGHGKLALQRLSDAARAGIHSSGKVLAEIAMGQSIVHMLSGELSLASQSAQKVRSISRQHAHPYVESWGVYLEASSRFRAHELEAALPLFIRASEQLYGMHVRVAVDVMVGLALTYHMMSRPDDAAEAVRKSLEFARATQDPQQLSVALSGQTRVALARGDVESATHWLHSFHEELFAPSTLMWLEVSCVTQARVLVAIGSPESLLQATELLATLRQASEALHNICQTIGIVVLQSFALHKQGRADEARQVLKEALELACPGRWIQPFIESGPPMADLLRQVVKEDSKADFAVQILERFGEVAKKNEEGVRPGRVGQVRSGQLSEPLTNRELEILGLLAKRLQNKEIAARLFVSPETVKTHLKHLYQKLGVANRHEAAAKAVQIVGEKTAGSSPKTRVNTG
jgi:LuxR family maltose regulon positive regulatory protein